MAISMDELMRAFGRPMNPNVQPVMQPAPGTGVNVPLAQPARAPAADLIQAQAPAAPQQPRGLLGGFFGPEGRDARARLAIALEGMTLNPNQALIGQLQQGIEGRATEKQRNATIEWLMSRGHDDLAAALEAGASPQDVLAEATRRMQPVQAERGVVVGGNVVNPLTGEVIYHGPERATGSDAPAAFIAMDMQARAAGFVPRDEGGDGSYEEFMATRGAGMAAEARAIGEQRGAAIAGAPVDVATADTTLQLIEGVRQHPGLDIGTGATSAGNILPGTPGYDFQNRVDQLLSGGFLTAIDQLRGMGALSNAEGQTATRAISRMDTATSKGAFLDALSDYENIVRMGRERAAARIQQPAVEQPAAPSVMPSDEELLRMYGGNNG